MGVFDPFFVASHDFETSEIRKIDIFKTIIDYGKQPPQRNFALLVRLNQSTLEIPPVIPPRRGITNTRLPKSVRKRPAKAIAMPTTRWVNQSHK